MRPLSLRPGEQLDSDTIEAKITVYYKTGNEDQMLRLGNHDSSKKFYIDIASLGSIALTNRLRVSLDKNIFTLEHDDEFEKDYFPTRVVFSFHTEYQYAHFCFHNMALKYCSLKEHNTNATIKPNYPPSNSNWADLDENLYEIIDKPSPSYPLDRVKRWLKEMTTSKKSDKVLESSLPVSRTSSSSSGNPAQPSNNEVYNSNPKLSISMPIAREELIGKLEKNYTLIETDATLNNDRLQDYHDGGGITSATYEEIHPVELPAPKYLDPCNVSTPSSSTTQVSRSNSLQRPSKTPPLPPPKENKPKSTFHGSLYQEPEKLKQTNKSSEVKPIAERRTETKSFIEIKNRFEESSSSPPRLKLFGSQVTPKITLKNTPKNTLNNAPKIGTHRSVVSITVKAPQPEKTDRPVSEPVSQVSVQRESVQMTLAERMKALQVAGLKH